MASILHMMGPTCAGKSTIINAMVALAPRVVFPVQIGKALRAKYGEDYFQGQAAPEKTREEAIQMYRDLIAKAIKESYEVIVIDGQPRDLVQAQEMVKSNKDHTNSFWLVHAAHNVREQRARAGRAVGPDLDLAVARLTNDYINNYTVMTELLSQGVQINVVDTGTKLFNVNEFADILLSRYRTYEFE